jgi:broad specificity phosphatase PhoE
LTAARVVLWRHGQTAFNASGRFQGQQDVPLDDVGAEQVKRSAESLSGLIGDDEPLRIVSSDLSRASSTASALSSLVAQPVSYDQRLREVHAGAWQGLLRDEIVASWPAEYAAWRAGDPDVRLGGDGETRRETASRCAACITELSSALEGGTLVCVGHGGALRGAVLELLGFPEFRWNMFGALGNAHWAVLTLPPAGWRLTAYNVSP